MINLSVKVKMWLVLSVLKLSVLSVLCAPYVQTNYKTNSQVYHPANFNGHKILPYGNNDAKISHTLSTINRKYGITQQLTPPPITNAPQYYSFAPTIPPLSLITQPIQQNYISPASVREQYTVSVSPQINYLPPIVTADLPMKVPHHDSEYQNTHRFEKTHPESDHDENDEDDDDDDYPQKYVGGSSIQKQQAARGNDPRDPKIKKVETKLPDRKDRIDFQVYGFDGPKSYKFGYDTGNGDNRQFRYETRDRDGNVSGRYGYMDRTGKLNVVKYTSNVDDGFRTEAL